MLRSFLLAILFILFIFPVTAQQYRKVTNGYFQRGEKLSFRIAYHSSLTGSLTAGTATLELTKDHKQIGGRDTFHAVGYGKTTGFIEVFYQIEERFESFIDESALIPWEFSRRTKENKYEKFDNVIFRQKDHVAISPNRMTPTPENVQDMVSAFYFARTFDLSGLKPGKEFPLPFFLDDSVYHSKIRFTGRETIRTRLGEFDCLKIEPMMPTGNVFNDSYPVKMWVTDDANRVPVLIESKLSVGSVRVELTGYTGLANPFTFRVK